MSIHKYKFVTKMVMYESFIFQNMAKADDSDKNCFCGGLAKFSEMLISVQALLCEAQGSSNQNREWWW